MANDDLPITEDLDFSYLLGLMRPLYNMDQYAWLPELFSIIGHERLIDLCRYCGGETITIPTLEELSQAVDALQSFYDCDIKQKIDMCDIPYKQRELVDQIREVYLVC